MSQFSLMVAVFLSLDDNDEDTDHDRNGRCRGRISPSIRDSDSLAVSINQRNEYSNEKVQGSVLNVLNVEVRHVLFFFCDALFTDLSATHREATLLIP